MLSEQMKSQINIGPAGWSYQNWQHVACPVPRPRGFHEVSYLANYFPVIEVKSSFEQPLRPEITAVWLKQVEHIPQFQFTAKLCRIFTHECILRREDVRAAQYGFAPLLEAGRLGAILMQFPSSFRASKENQNYLTRLREAFRDFPLVAELRHVDWNQEDLLRQLTDREIGFANIDQPQSPHSMPVTAHATSQIGYFRLHGRNYAEWNSSASNSFSLHNGASEQTRYNYLYSTEQLAAWSSRIKSVSQQTVKTFVVTNNHFRGQALVNALQLMSIISNRQVNVPPQLRNAYSKLIPITKNIPKRRSLFMFPVTTTRHQLIAS
ncbi:MAG: hypothetical protein CMN58_00865 [Solibacterales bacterium]|nr:hypothetical protein [Bryobacterales bacterium]